ncbi:hypothetical protein H9Q72_014431 [Fusarium xylarioides]|uniref:Reverse transcriptase domain-containing protein n=1 Tax=Fusarium xylarioides TaxID=221167 RepID=A0A9P7HAU1_9HYPO|nr:hypothetical protein H9Q72_014431 [Fusarium xylarioides]
MLPPHARRAGSRRQAPNVGNRVPPFIILQANVMHSKERVYSLLEYAREQTTWPHIIAIQDPPKRFPWMQTQGYKANYNSLSELPSDRHYDELTIPERRKISLSGVCFLVSNEIPASDWDVFYHGNHNKTMAATLVLQTLNKGKMKIHNVYNRSNQINIQRMVQACNFSGNDVLLGDFNLHHRDWTGVPSTRYERKAWELRASMQAARLKLLTPRGAETWASSVRNGYNCFTIDLTYATENIWHRKLFCRPIDVRRFESDHAVIKTVLDVSTTKDETLIWLWKLLPRKKFVAAVEKALKPLASRRPRTTEEVDELLEAINEAILACIKQFVPSMRRADRARPRQTVTDVVKKARRQEQQALDKYRRNPTKRWQRYWKRRRKAAIKADIETRRTNWRYKTAARASEPHGIFGLSRMRDFLAKPRDLPQVSELIDESGIYREAEEKTTCMTNAIWPGTTEQQTTPEPLKPLNRRGRRAFARAVSRKLAQGEIAGIIGKLKRTAAGPDGISNEVLRMLVNVITPYLEVCFEACLLLKYHPKSFKHAITVMIPKGGKPLNLPGSWRPLALLSCTGKILERVIADRLKELVTRFKLLPRTQYGLPGKSTTMALQYLLNPVYSAFTREPKRYVSLLSIDIKGAYDRVNRRVLIEILQDLGIPSWLVEIVASFLSYRTTVLRLPGLNQRKVWILIGIPQGSPLSPILFLFYTAPMLSMISDETWRRENPEKFKLVKFYAFAYIDDTYIMVASPSYEENVKALNFAHDLILEWAGAAGVTFSTGKYHLMHFKPPWSREEDCNLLVDIQGYNTENEPAAVIKILGVFVDHRLRWTDHIAKISARVRMLVARLEKDSNSISGPSMLSLVQLYIAKIRAIITYACPAWLCYGDYHTLDRCLSGLDDIQWHMENDNVKPLWEFTEANMSELQKLQSLCLHKISGALWLTHRIEIEKELAVEDIKTVLVRLATAHRARILDSPEHDMLEEVRNDLDKGGRRGRSRRNPFVVYDNHARLLRNTVYNKMVTQFGEEETNSRWGDHQIRNRAIDKAARQLATAAMCKRWDDYRRQEAQNPHRTSVILGSWGRENRKRYLNLSRAQSTMLIQCRTEMIRLNNYQFTIRKASTWECPCGNGTQTAYHMFMVCDLLDAARHRLRAHLRYDFHFPKLMDEDADVATQWAIVNFDLPEYKWPKANRLTMPTDKQSDLLPEGT